MRITERFMILLPPTFTEYDIHVRKDGSGVAWVGVYDRQAETWTDTASGSLTAERAAAALDAVRS